MRFLCFWALYLFCWHHWLQFLPWYSWHPFWPEDIAAASAGWSELTLLTLVCSWLTVCAILDCHSRRVPNWLTLPVVGLSLLYRFEKFTLPFVMALALIIGLLFLCWWKQQLGGADFKALVALLLFDPALAVWAALGLLVSYSGLRTVRGCQAVKKMPAFCGFALGSYIYLATRCLNG